MSEAARVICWFSCGASSAVATKLTLVSATPPITIVYIYIKEEDDDNLRFLKDCEEWFQHPILILRNEKYHSSIYEVFERKQYLVGPSGAPCSNELKRRVREGFQLPGDVHVYGFEEEDRAENIVEKNPTLRFQFPLIERHLSKEDCLAMIRDAGIELPRLYREGFEHNNCVGCVKGGMGHWNKVRIYRPENFYRMAKLERQIGASCIRQNGESVYLDELDPNAGRDLKEPSIQCGIFCEIAKQEYAP